MQHMEGDDRILIGVLGAFNLQEGIFVASILLTSSFQQTSSALYFCAFRTVGIVMVVAVRTF